MVHEPFFREESETQQFVFTHVPRVENGDGVAQIVSRQSEQYAPYSIPRLIVAGSDGKTIAIMFSDMFHQWSIELAVRVDKRVHGLA
jgi:hypothetical protein